MNLKIQIDETEKALQVALQKFNSLDFSPRPPANLTKIELQKINQEYGRKLARLGHVAYDQIDSLNAGLAHLLSRVSYALRFRTLIWHEDAISCASSIDRDMAMIGKVGNIAASFLVAAAGLAPSDTDRKVHTEQITNLHLSKASTIADAIMRSPLSDAECAEVHQPFSTPENPLEAYIHETEGLTTAFTYAAKHAVKRIHLGHDIVSYAFDVLAPAFLQHADLIKRNANQFFIDAAESEKATQAMLTVARRYAGEADAHNLTRFF